jgi:hypothetical protein
MAVAPTAVRAWVPASVRERSRISSEAGLSTTVVCGWPGLALCQNKVVAIRISTTR